MITTYIVFFISLWIHECRSQCTKEKPFFMIDKQCANFNDVCVKTDYDPCKSLLQACAQCPTSNLTESALVNMLTILRDQRNTTTSHFDARLNNFSLGMKSQMNQQNKTTEANYKRFEARLNISEREILEKLALVEKRSIAICVLVVLLVILFVILLVLIEMRWQPFKLSPRNAGASSNIESIPLMTYRRFDETNHQNLENIEDQIQTMPQAPSGAAASSEQQNGDLSINNSSKFYILETNVSKSTDFNIESMRLIEIRTRQIESIFDHIEKVNLCYSIVESVGNIKKKIADSLSNRDKNKIPAKNVILFCKNKNLNDDVFLFEKDIDIKQLKFCHLKPWDDSIRTQYVNRGDYSKIFPYMDTLNTELVLKQYAWQPMKILKVNEAILNELETFQITKSQEGFVHLNGVFTDKNYFYVSMEKMEGSIKDYMKNINHPLPNETIAKWAKQILSALEYLHSNGIIHRNIKPSSILLDKVENIKLQSFGLGKHALWGDKKCWKEECKPSWPGAYRYMAPEHCTDEICGVKSDVWSFGTTMIEMATSKQPFDNMGEGKVINKIGTTKQILYTLDKNRSSNLKDFIDQCLIKDPNYRATVDNLLKHDFLRNWH